jgi:hypothetical protein
MFLVATLGTTSSGAIDHLTEIGEVGKTFNLVNELLAAQDPCTQYETIPTCGSMSTPRGPVLLSLALNTARYYTWKLSTNTPIHSARIFTKFVIPFVREGDIDELMGWQ